MGSTIYDMLTMGKSQMASVFSCCQARPGLQPKHEVHNAMGVLLRRALAQCDRAAELDSVLQKLADQWIYSTDQLRVVSQPSWCTIGLPLGLYLAVQLLLADEESGSEQLIAKAQQTMVTATGESPQTDKVLAGKCQRPTNMAMWRSVVFGSWASLVTDAFYPDDPRHTALGKWDSEVNEQIRQAIETQQSSIAVVSTLLFSMIAVAVPNASSFVPVLCGANSTGCNAADAWAVLTMAATCCLACSTVSTLVIILIVRQIKIEDLQHFMTAASFYLSVPFASLQLGMFFFLLDLVLLPIPMQLTVDYSDFTKYLTFCMITLLIPIILMFIGNVVRKMYNAKAVTLMKTGELQ